MLFRLGFMTAVQILGHANVTGSAANLSGKEAVIYMLNTSVIHEYLIENSTKHISQPYGDLRKGTHSFDMLNPTERRAYWTSLQYFFFTYPKSVTNSHGVNTDGSQVSQCFPFCNVPEAVNDKNFGAREDCTEGDIERVRNYVSNNDVPLFISQMDSGKIDDISKALSVPFEAVVKGIARLRWKKRTKRLDGLMTRVPRRGRREALKTTLEATEEDIMEEDEDLEPIILHPEPPELPTRKRNWLESEDRQMLYAWVTFMCRSGANKPLVWKHIKDRPLSVKPQSCKHRLLKLKEDDNVKQFMEDIVRQTRAVHDRQLRRRVEASDSKTATNCAKKKKSNAQGGPNLFELHDDDDLESLQNILNAIENVIQAAPMRQNESLSSNVFDKIKTRKYRDDDSPVDLFLKLKAHARRTKTAIESGNVPGLEVTASMAAIISCLVQNEYDGIAFDEIEKRLSLRFKADVLNQAMALLMKAELISGPDNAEAIPLSAYHLTERFKSEAEPPFSPSIFWPNAGKALEQTHQLWPLLDPTVVASIHPMLALVAMGHVQMKIEIPESIKKTMNSSDSPTPQPSENWLKENMSYAKILDIFEAKKLCAPSRLPPHLVRYQPDDVLNDVNSYNNARDAFMQNTKKLANVSISRSILEMTRNAGMQGLSRSGLRQFLQINNVECKKAFTYESMLQKYGLARLVEGFNETHMVSPEISNHLTIKLKKEPPTPEGKLYNLSLKLCFHLQRPH